MIDKIRDERFLKKVLLIFFMLQPILDCYLLYTDEVISFFKFSPTTIIRLLIIGVLFILLFFNKDNKENRRPILIYGAVITVYTVLHIMTTYNFDISGFKSFEFSIISEILYIVRMLLPIFMIFIVYSLKITKEELIKTLLAVAFLSSFIIIAMNLLTVSLASYGKLRMIDGNIFTWFSENRPDPRDLASKGWFNSANQISGLFVLLLPIIVYSIFEKCNIKRIIILFMTLLAMIMLGTRVSSIGWVLIVSALLVIYLMCCLIFKTAKFSKKSFTTVLLVTITSSALLFFSPLVNYSDNTDYEALNEQNLKNKLKEEEKKLENLTIEERLPYLGINQEYYEKLYPYEEHKEFWKYVVLDTEYYERNGNRNTQNLVFNDINNNYETVFTPLFGLSNSRFINAEIYLENDYKVHYYTIGIVGICLFLMPYIVILIYCAYQIVIKNRKKLTMYNVCLLSAIFLPIAISILSGHIMDELIVSLFLGLIAGHGLIQIKAKEE